MSMSSWDEVGSTTAVDVEGPVARVVLIRPNAANARNQQMRRELGEIWRRISLDDSIAVVTLTGAGEKFFCAGMDMKEAGQEESAAALRDRLRLSRDIEQLASLPQVTIAAINGYAIGGGLEMALACDLRIAAERAQVGLPELSHGLVPGGGGTQRLPRLVGPARAAEMLFLGSRLTGVEAFAAGLVNRCVPMPVLQSTVDELAQAIAKQPARALRYGKELLRKSQEVPLSAGVDYELELLLALLADRQG